MTVTFGRDESVSCAIGNLWRWLKIRPKKSKWLFCHSNGSPIKAIWVQAILKEKLQAIGCSSDQFVSGISLRKGGALTLALCGVPDRVIQVFGRWKSDAYRVYVDMTEQEKKYWQSVVTDRLACGEPVVQVSVDALEEMRLRC